MAAKLEPGGRDGGVPPRPPPSPGRRPPPPPSAAGAGGPRPAPRAHGRPRARRLEAADRPRRLPPPPARLPRSSEPAAESPAGRVKRVREGERDPGSWLPPPRRRAPGLRGGSGREVGSERAAEELSRPGSVCTSAGNVPLTYIFFQTYVTFFFSLSLSRSVGGDRRGSKKRRSWKENERGSGGKKIIKPQPKNPALNQGWLHSASSKPGVRATVRDRSGIPAPRCRLPLYPVSSHPHVPISLHPFTPTSLYPHLPCIPTSPHPYISIPVYPPIPRSLPPRIPTSLHPPISDPRTVPWDARRDRIQVQPGPASLGGRGHPPPAGDTPRARSKPRPRRAQAASPDVVMQRRTGN